MASAGRILIMPKGIYDPNITYEMLDLVKHNGTAWLAKKTVVGIEPSANNAEYWHNLFDLDLTAIENRIKALEDERTQVSIGTYTGIGKFGAENPTTLTFQFKPMLVFIQNLNSAADSGLAWMYGAEYGKTTLASSNDTMSVVQLTWGENSVSWYSSDSVNAQLNVKDDIYNYIVIG